VEIENKKAVVVGCGKTGRSTATFLARRGARVTVTDAAAASVFKDAAPGLSNLGVALEFGGHRPETFAGADMIIVSPGVSHTIAPLAAARAAGTPVMGEIELAFRFITAPILAVTGTNGKSTVTLLAGEMLKASGLKVFVGGNLGTPLIDSVEADTPPDRIVAEISSFQLDTIDSFRPAVAVLLNITDDHLDRYPDAEAYARSKGKIFMNQGPADTAVINMADPVTRRIFDERCADAVHEPPRRFIYGMDADQEQPEGRKADGRAWISGRELWFETPEWGVFSVPRADIVLSGRHNLENICAAGLAVLAAGGTPEGVTAAVRGFTGLPHRVQHVDTVNGVQYIDDSKATNVDAAARALEAFDNPVVLIMGGRDKGGSYAPLKSRFAGRVRHLVVLGEAAAKIAAELKDAAPITRAATMDAAVLAAGAVAVSGDTVLLSPACSSFDMYESYARRGEDFARAVREMREMQEIKRGAS
jgi:UDP-N-acetylmuramoylalanine--D-glutamate ligase